MNEEPKIEYVELPVPEIDPMQGSEQFGIIKREVISLEEFKKRYPLFQSKE